MALSMDEQRILAEIERRLAADDPYLAGNLSAFTRPRLGASIRAAKGRLLATVVAVAAVALAALVIYSFVPFRVIARQNDQPTGQQTTQQANQRTTQQAKASPPAATASASPVTSDTPARPAPARQTAPVPR
jgi:cytoskeletal protein RodZ